MKQSRKNQMEAEHKYRNLLSMLKIQFCFPTDCIYSTRKLLFIPIKTYGLAVRNSWNGEVFLFLRKLKKRTLKKDLIDI